MKQLRVGVLGALVLVTAVVAAPTGAGSTEPGGLPGGDVVAAHWTAARMEAAEPRDLVIDGRGLGYLRRADGTLEPHGHARDQLWASPAPVSLPAPAAKPGGGGGGGTDTEGPDISGMDPVGTTIGASHTFRATVTDPSGVKSVTFVIYAPSGQAYSFAASANDDVWSVSLQGFSDGGWTWEVVARDGFRKGNTSTSDRVAFTVSTDGGNGGGDGGGGGDGTVVNDPWPGGGTVQTAAGRIYFEMPVNRSQKQWRGYVCSGTVAEDGTPGRSVILTAAHCVYDDANRAFARNVLFIPDQAGTTGTGTDLDCTNDPMGCWSPAFGVVAGDWASRTFPANIPWDYAYYVVPDSGAHSGNAASSTALDDAAGALAVKFSQPTTGTLTHALGYSYSEDPKFMYCAEPLATESSYGSWWLGQCGLSGGSSGGPWLQPVSGGDGPIVSVNSWGYTNQPGMAGPVLGDTASCLFGTARTHAFEQIANRGVISC